MLSRVPKSYAVISASILAILFFVVRYRPSSDTPIWHSSSSWLDWDERANMPLLGPEEIPAALWLPSKGSKFKPEVPKYNRLQPDANRIRTPLFIAFTRNYDILEQTILSYISVGWPREDIVVVDNSGTLDANNHGHLSRDNPFFLDYQRLRSTYGVSILQTPTLFNFAQLMNFYLRTAIAQDWAFYFWGHQDVAVLSDETAQPYRSFYEGVLDILGELGVQSLHRDPSSSTMRKEKWAVKWFHYDWLSLNNVEAWRVIGHWDTFIPYYTTDCDAYSRILLNGFTREEVRVGHIFDVPDAIPDLTTKLFSSDLSEGPNSPRFTQLYEELDTLMKIKWQMGERDRNTWQSKQNGGKGEPWTYDPSGFQYMWWETAKHGQALFSNKWGSSECQLERTNLTLEDEFHGLAESQEASEEASAESI
jgi:hypothetical protein